MRILIVEDDPDIRELFAELFKEERFETTTCADGDDALERLARQPFELVVMDLLIPRPHGLNVLARLRSTPGPNASVPVIVCTGLLTSDSKNDDPRILGADAVLPKPVDLGELLDCVYALAGLKCEAAR